MTSTPNDTTAHDGLNGITRDPLIDTTKPHVARVYDYLLGGDANFDVDKAAAWTHASAFGGLDASRTAVRANRDFLVRVVRWLVAHDVRQFLDIGTGIPNDDNVHAVAQAAAPTSRIVCVDNDPTVLAHAHLLMHSTPEGAAKFVAADLHDPGEIILQAAETLDMTKPVAVLLVALLHLVKDDSSPYDLVGELMQAVPPGSYLVMSHMASDIEAERITALAQSVSEDAKYRFVPRDRDQFARFFAGLELAPPGIVPVHEWHPDEDTPSDLTHFYGAVGLKS
jgi:hypothetical protein